MIDHKKLLEYEAELRRIAEHREKGTEKKIKVLCSNMAKDLQSFLANEYALNADTDDKLTFATMYQKGRYARFLEETVNHIDSYTPEIQREIKSLIEDTYRTAYEGLCESVKGATDSEALRNNLSMVKSVQPEVLNQTVENPISGLTLPERFEKYRTDIIYDIKQEIGVGLSVGEKYSTMARRIRDKCNFGYTKAIRIVRTEAHRVREAGLNDCANEIDEAIKSGTSGLIGVKIWHTMRDERVRPQVRRKTKKGWKSSMGKGANHMVLEGQTVKIGEKFDLGDGVKADTPGKSGVAGHDINCRCFVTHDWLTAEEYAAAVKKQGDKTVDKSAESGIIKERASKPKQPIIDAAIDRVPKVEIEGYSSEQCEIIQNQHKELLKFARDENNGNEVAFVLDRDLKRVSTVKGSDKDISFDGSNFRGDKLLVMHNHPRGSSFSDSDVICFAKFDNIKTFSIAKHSGDIEYITKTSDFNKNLFFIEYNRLFKKTVKGNTDVELDRFIKKLLSKTKAGVIWNGNK